MKKQPTGDPAHDVLGYEKRSLDAIFRPTSVAVIGATDEASSVGRTVMRNLINNPFGGTVYPVNPNRPSVSGIKAYWCVSEVPEPVDLAVIVTPAPTVPGIVRECAEAGVQGAIVISAGFKEAGEEGGELERQVLGEARQDPGRGPQLSRGDEPEERPQRHLRRGHGEARQRRIFKPERRPLHRHPRLEPRGERRVLTLRLGRLDDRRRLGRLDLLPRRRLEDEEHPHLYGVHRRRPLVPLGGAGGGAHQAGHRHKGRPY